ncbi:hypothetical protein GCM10011572_20170 [Pseudoduganella buxea]|uniref:Potassium-transporting ATPase subunit F n=2 Tax=Pseudoduganella buxea TaxID=1949069 RepID=A0ABQ1KJR8_9BURK|nr:hypothetical protein GCM10011572_20170 [Pseudoduganella buxea]
MGHGGGVRPPGERIMNALYLAGAVLAAALMMYLLVALLRAEQL